MVRGLSNGYRVIRRRLDEALVARGLYPTRARARDAILRGTVSVDGAIVRKPSQAVSERAEIAIADPARPYVSRAALKLKHALAHFAISARGLSCLDIGASTGGFTQVLLEEGAAHVTAVDVGHGQMAEKLRQDPRVTLLEGLNIRDLAEAHLPQPVALIVCDVSFISLKLALPPALRIAGHGARLVALIKPQFEAGRAANANDPHEQARICREIEAFIAAQGWRILGLTPSPITGSDGSHEFLIAAEKREA